MLKYLFPKLVMYVQFGGQKGTPFQVKPKESEWTQFVSGKYMYFVITQNTRLDYSTWCPMSNPGGCPMSTPTHQH